MAATTDAAELPQACCLGGFRWAGEPTGTTTTLASLPTYVAGSNPAAAVLLIHDLLGWTFPNIRLLADAYAAEADVTVYVRSRYEE